MVLCANDAVCFVCVGLEERCEPRLDGRQALVAEEATNECLGSYLARSLAAKGQVDRTSKTSAEDTKVSVGLGAKRKGRQTLDIRRRAKRHCLCMV